MTTLSHDPIIVLGAPRSGTTYLQTVIDRHPEVALSNEVRLFEWMHRAFAQADDERALFEQRDEFVAWLRSELPALVRRYYETNAPDARWWGDKNPHYAETEPTLQTIAALFPGARFVHIVRDPRAVIASLLKKRHADGTPWVGPEDGHVLAGTHLNVATAFGRSCEAEQFYELRYEDLVADDEGVARALFSWLDIPFADEVESFCRQQAGERTSVSGPTSDLSEAGSRAAAVAAWEAAIPAASRRKSLAFLAPYLLQFGYETEESVERITRALPPADPSLGEDPTKDDQTR